MPMSKLTKFCDKYMQVFVSQLYLNKVAWEKSGGYHR